MEELKPEFCPFCGSKKVGCYESWTHWACQCDECGATMVKRGSKEEAIEAWNTRAERTCSNNNTEKPYSIFFRCSYCGYPNTSAIDAQILAADVNYCPNCGAKVVA